MGTAATRRRRSRSKTYSSPFSGDPAPSAFPVVQLHDIRHVTHRDRRHAVEARSSWASDANQKATAASEKARLPRSWPDQSSEVVRGSALFTALTRATAWRSASSSFGAFSERNSRTPQVDGFGPWSRRMRRAGSPPGHLGRPTSSPTSGHMPEPGHMPRGRDGMATTLVPGDLVIHPHDTHPLATVVQVRGDFVAIKDDFGVVVTEAGESFWSSQGLL